MLTQDNAGLVEHASTTEMHNSLPKTNVAAIPRLRPATLLGTLLFWTVLVAF